MGAQKIRGRLDTSEAHGGRLFKGFPDQSIEISMRGMIQFLLGLSRRYRHASRTWGAMLHNVSSGSNSEQLSDLFSEYEEALARRKQWYHLMDTGGNRR